MRDSRKKNKSVKKGRKVRGGVSWFTSLFTGSKPDDTVQANNSTVEDNNSTVQANKSTVEDNNSTVQANNSTVEGNKSTVEANKLPDSTIAPDSIVANKEATVGGPTAGGKKQKTKRKKKRNKKSVKKY